MELHDVFQSDERPFRRSPLAAAVGIKRDVRRKKRTQRLHVAAPGGREERLGDCKPAILRHREPWTLSPDMRESAARELAAGGLVAADRLGDLVEADAEHVVQKKGRALERRQALERHHERQRDIVDLVVRRLDDRLRQPRANIGLALSPRRLQLIEADAGHDAAKVSLRLAHRRAIDAEPAQERVLDRVLRVGDRPQHAIGDANQSRTQRIKAGARIPGLREGHAALFSSTGWTARKPTWIRFQPLIVTMSSVSATCSSSEKCVLSA